MKKISRKAKPKPAKHASKDASKPSIASRLPLIIAGVAILILIIGGAIWYAYTHPTGNGKQSAAVVNGKAITGQQLEFQYSLLPSSYKESFSKDQVLEQIIDEELIVQAAQRHSISTTPQDVNERVQQILAQNDLAPGDLQKNLEELNITLEDFEKLIGRQIVIERYLNLTLKKTDVDDATLEGIYNATKSKYILGEQVTVRHILIAQQRPDAAIVAKKVYDDVRNGSDFCKLVLNYSDDRGSKESCGQYTFPRGFMPPEFEKASFEMKDGEVRVVQTTFGHHIIRKINSTPAAVRPFSEVRDAIRSEYESADRSKQYRELVSSLRRSATVVYANGTRIMPQRPVAAVSPVDGQREPANNTTVILDDSGIAVTLNGTGNGTTAPGALANATRNATNATVAPPAQANGTNAVSNAAANTTVNNTVINSTPVANRTPPVNAPANTTPVNTTANNVTQPAANATQNATAPAAVRPVVAQPDLHGLFACIASKSKLYGASWDSASQSARQMFIAQGADIQYIECDTQKDACSGIKAYPTWNISGTVYIGEMTPAMLQQATGCQ